MKYVCSLVLVITYNLAAKVLCTNLREGCHIEYNWIWTEFYDVTCQILSLLHPLYGHRRTHWQVFDNKAELSQRWPHDALYIWMPWKISGVPDYANGYFSQNSNGLFFRLMPWICVQNLKFAALPVPEITAIGVLGGLQTHNLFELRKRP